MQILQLEPWQILLVFSPLIFVFWALWHISTRTFQSVNEKYYWIVFCGLVPVIGALIYVLFGIRRSTKTNS